MTFLATLIIEFEGAIQLQIVVGITKAAIRIAIPQQSIILIRQHERDTHLRIILEQILVLALHIKLLALVLTQSVECLILWAIEFHLP